MRSVLLPVSAQPLTSRQTAAAPPLARRWEAVLLVLDARPFEDLHHIVQDFHDDRIWVFAEWVSAARWGGLGSSPPSLLLLLRT